MKCEKYKHDSDILNKYLGKKVKITFFDNEVEIGILKKEEKGHKALIYILNTGTFGFVNFAKTHVKKIEEV